MEKELKNYEYICGDLTVNIPYEDYEMLSQELERIADIFKDLFLGIYGSEQEELKIALEDEDFEVVSNI